MKTLIITSILAVLVATATAAVPQREADEYLGLPGDNLNLYAVMKLFQESETLDGFERTLNDENSRINNLDLNGDNLVDYLTVNDYVDGNVHNIVLRAALGKNEYQDVAVFTVQRFSDGSVQIQLTGDEALYGRNYIIEPIYGDSYTETPNPGYTGRVNNTTIVRTTVYAVADWPVIRFIYFPGYAVWRSSGTGVITRYTGTRGAPSTGISTSDTIITGTDTTTAITGSGIISVTLTTTTFTTERSDHTHLTYTTGSMKANTGTLTLIPNRDVREKHFTQGPTGGRTPIQW